MKTLNIFYLVIYWTQKVHNDFIFLYSLHCHLSATLQTISITVVSLQDNRAVFRIFIALFKFFICLSLIFRAVEWIHVTHQLEVFVNPVLKLSVQNSGLPGYDAGSVVSNGSREGKVFIFGCQEFRPLTKNVLGSFKTSGAAHSTTQRNIPRDSDLQKRDCETVIKERRVLIFTVQEAQEEWRLEPLQQKKAQRASETSTTNKPAT